MKGVRSPDDPILTSNQELWPANAGLRVRFLHVVLLMHFGECRAHPCR
jgi:hypothetical protein